MVCCAYGAVQRLASWYKSVRTVPGSVERSVVLCVETRQWRADFAQKALKPHSQKRPQQVSPGLLVGRYNIPQGGGGGGGNFCPLK